MELLDLLRCNPEDDAVLQAIVGLQTMTRRVRRQLVIMAQNTDSEPPADEEKKIQKLSSELDVVEDTLGRLSGDGAA